MTNINSNYKFKCRLCNSENLKEIANLNGFPKAAQFFVHENLSNLSEDIPITLTVVQCIQCSLVQLTNPPVNYYKDVITTASLSESSKNKLAKEWKAFIEKYNLTEKMAIEIGAGRGDFLDVLQKLNLKCTGLEHSQNNINICMDKGNYVYRGYLLDWNSKIKYSLVVCNNYLEHQPESGNFIKKLSELLDHNGILYLSVPNLDYLVKKSCLYEFVADHLVYFTQESLRIACEINALNVVETYLKNNGNDIVIVARKRQPINLLHSQIVVDEIVLSLKECVSRFRKNNKKIAIWGAGHRALALMAISQLEEIEYVIDSADFKQGKFTPILHKKIISPQEFEKKGCNCVIIMLPGAYAQQVIEYINEKNIDCEVIIFEDRKLDY
jgi:2-polyprenyl-3-methyl-5-hydroxy-6-metoxy-1,4-benzoquinol methylase